MTTSHLRFGPDPIHAPYLIKNADFVACHQTPFLEKINLLRNLKPGGKFLINVPWAKEDVWKNLPRELQKNIIEKQAKVFIINAQKVAEESGMGRRINTVMQVCFFGISGVLPKKVAIEAIKKSIVKTYGKKGTEIVNMNLKAVDNTLAHLYPLEIPKRANGKKTMENGTNPNAPDFVDQVLQKIIDGNGDDLPVSAFPVDGTFPTATAQFEKRNIALKIPVWDEDICIQCGKCAMVCPHAVIRIKAFPEKHLKAAPSSFKVMDVREKEWKEDNLKYSIQVSPEDCTGCSVCVEVCPVKNKSNVSLKALNMMEQAPLLDQEKENWNYFLDLPELDRNMIKNTSIGQQQIQQPLFEFSGACSGCGETPYLKLVSQLFGDRTIIANATGCSSIYGGNLPTTPWAKNKDGLGPAWSNSLFEDNAEFGLGFRLSIDQHNTIAISLLKKLSRKLDKELVRSILESNQKEETEIFEQRERVKQLKKELQKIKSPDATRLIELADYLVKKSVWIVGGDGWAYDIGFGGLDHVIASGKNVNILVMDTEVYSNTGGQMSKSTPISAVAKFAASGKPAKKKDLGLMAMSYGHAYVATVAMGAKDLHTLKTFIEAEAYDGPSIIIAYSHCIAHGINMEAPLQNQKAAVDSGQWLLYRYNPELLKEDKNPLSLDSKPKKLKVADYMNMENRFRMLIKSNPELAKRFYKDAQDNADQRLNHYEYLASESFQGPGKLNDNEL